jgi:hypothetical protein
MAGVCRPHRRDKNNPEGNKPYGRNKLRLEQKGIILKEMEWLDVDFINLAQNRNECQVVVNTKLTF